MTEKDNVIDEYFRRQDKRALREETVVTKNATLLDNAKKYWWQLSLLAAFIIGGVAFIPDNNDDQVNKYPEIVLAPEPMSPLSGTGESVTTKQDRIQEGVVRESPHPAGNN